MIENRPQRRSDELLKARQERVGARYFITFCTTDRARVLTRPEIVGQLMQELRNIAAEGILSRSSFVIMPDHLHWLFMLSDRLTLGQVVGRVKSKTRPALQSAGASWQRNFFEHRLRADDLMEPFAQYMFLNPYRAGLISLEKPWPYWINDSGIRFEFEDRLTENGTPPKSWLIEVKRPFFLKTKMA